MMMYFGERRMVWLAGPIFMPLRTVLPSLSAFSLRMFPYPNNVLCYRKWPKLIEYLPELRARVLHWVRGISRSFRSGTRKRWGQWKHCVAVVRRCDCRKNLTGATRRQRSLIVLSATRRKQTSADRSTKLTHVQTDLPSSHMNSLLWHIFLFLLHARNSCQIIYFSLVVTQPVRLHCYSSNKIVLCYQVTCSWCSETISYYFFIIKLGILLFPFNGIAIHVNNPWRYCKRADHRATFLFELSCNPYSILPHFRCKLLESGQS